jgi:stage V sporulation protein B
MYILLVVLISIFLGVKMASKLARGSVIIFIGNIIFRIGGYVYRFLMATLLGPAAYGILGITLPFQGIFQILSAGGLPPAIAKYVSQYNALNKEDLAHQTVYTALKIMVFLGILMGILMVFLVAPWLANILNKPEALLPLQAVGLITPFSVIVGAFRGAFQGVYKMEYILYTRAIEQLFMILCAVALVMIGLSAFGAVLGSVLGFALSALSAYIIFKKYMGKYIPKPGADFIFTKKQEIQLSISLITFSIPVTIAALAEMAIYSACTIIMGYYLSSTLIGYYTAADPIGRLPLIISSSLATTILPAVSEAYSLKDKNLLEKYVTNAYKYGMVFVVPMCVGIALYSKEILNVVYFTNHAYMAGAAALAVLVIGMTFYSVFTISSSIVQGIGNPRVPMYILVFGTIVTVALGFYLIPLYGILGGSWAITIASIAMMVPMLIITFHITKTKAPIGFFAKIVIASIIMGLPIYFIQYFLGYSIIGLIIGLILCPIIYLILLVVFKTLEPEDIVAARKFGNKFGPLTKYVQKIINIVERFV